MIKVKVPCRMKWCYNPTRKEDGSCDKWCFYNTKEVLTNGDRIRAMSDEELADFLVFSDWCDGTCGNPGVCQFDCKEHMMTWLKKEVTHE